VVPKGHKEAKVVAEGHKEAKGVADGHKEANVVAEGHKEAKVGHSRVLVRYSQPQLLSTSQLSSLIQSNQAAKASVL
jgi:hypothetical protein